MSFQSNKSELENIFSSLNQQASSTGDAWNDPVQQRFYSQFIDSLPKEVKHFLNELNRLDKSFESAERTINNL